MRLLLLLKTGKYRGVRVVCSLEMKCLIYRDASGNMDIFIECGVRFGDGTFDGPHYLTGRRKYVSCLI